MNILIGIGIGIGIVNVNEKSPFISSIRRLMWSYFFLFDLIFPILLFSFSVCFESSIRNQMEKIGGLFEQVDYLIARIKRKIVSKVQLSFTILSVLYLFLQLIFLRNIGRKEKKKGVGG